MERRKITTLGLATLTVMAVAVLLWAAGSAGASPSLALPAAQSGAPMLLNYQGRLVDPVTGEPVPNGFYAITFRIYDAANGGALVWAETQTVQVEGGLFNVLLGSVTALNAADFDGTARWLELEVEGETLTPRQRIVSTAYAIQAEWAKNVENADLLDGQHGDYYLTWGNLTGMPAGFADGVDSDTLGGLSPCGDGQVAKWDNGAGQWECADDDSGGAGGDFWALTGNAGTAPPTNFLGTTDEVSLTLAVSNTAALRLEPNATSPNVIGGHSDNSVTAGVYGATIGGGGASGGANNVTTKYGTVGGGRNNTASASNGYATVGGGESNQASEDHATVGGGESNEASQYYATVAGGSENTAGEEYATVGGGYVNEASGYASTVGGGGENTASGPDDGYATVGGGESNEASEDHATVGGGYYNNVSADFGTIAGGGSTDPESNPSTTNNRVTDDYGAIGGGGGNQAGDGDADTTDATYATVGGGYQNTASLYYATVGGGYQNTASGSSDGYATVGGGSGNEASGDYATVGGGSYNEASGDYATVGGGSYNAASGESATVGGGKGNEAGGESATVGGGESNLASGSYATVGGGWSNLASGDNATVPGGLSNGAAGNYSFAAGRRAKANHQGAFVWADSTDADFASIANDQFMVRASGGISMYTNSTLTSGMYLSPGGSSWNGVSDRERKENFASVDTSELLARLAENPITTWNYKAQDPSIRHIGPMAQDFNALIEGLGGEGEKYINTLDADGVALAAIQGLYQLSQEQAARIEELEAENAAQQAQIADLEERMTALEAQSRSPLGSWGPLGLLLGGLLVGLVVVRRNDFGRRWP